MNSPQMVPRKQSTLIKKFYQMRLGMFQIGNRSKGKVLIQISLNYRILHGEGSEHLNSSLTVTEIMNFLFRDIVNVLEVCRLIVLSHVLESELPEFFVFVWIVFYMLSRMLVASTVSEPNIKSSISQQKCRCFIFIVNDPAIGRIK